MSLGELSIKPDSPSRWSIAKNRPTSPDQIGSGESDLVAASNPTITSMLLYNLCSRTVGCQNWAFCFLP